MSYHLRIIVTGRRADYETHQTLCNTSRSDTTLSERVRFVGGKFQRSFVGRIITAGPGIR
jgi:hypothetical protein